MRRTSSRHGTVLAWAATVAVLAPVVALTAVPATRLDEALPILPWSAAAAASGNDVGNRQSLLDALHDRAARAERTREEEALRRR